MDPNANDSTTIKLARVHPDRCDPKVLETCLLEGHQPVGCKRAAGLGKAETTDFRDLAACEMGRAEFSEILPPGPYIRKRRRPARSP